MNLKKQGKPISIYSLMAFPDEFFEDDLNCTREAIENGDSNVTDILLDAVFTEPLQTHPPQALNVEETLKVTTFHRSVNNYAPTPLHNLRHLADEFGLAGLYVKDESFRFGLNAFKSLGATWAVARILCDRLDRDILEIDFSFFRQQQIKDKIKGLTFTTATDGNHGRGLAWAARQFGCLANIFMPKGTVPGRVSSIEAEGATVTVTDMNYDDTVRMAAALARRNGWIIVQDTAWEGYEDIPLWIVQGYTTMAAEALDQIKSDSLPMPTHLFLQAGVGSMAAAVLGYFANVLGDTCPAAYIIEPDRADCLFRSAKAEKGQPVAVTGDLNTMMAGLACGEPNPFAWKILKDFSSGFISCSDGVAALGMIYLAHPNPGDTRIVSGESGAVGPGLAHVLMNSKSWADIRTRMGLDKKSVLLCFSTEGDTDPINFQRITGLDRHGRSKSGHNPT